MSSLVVLESRSVLRFCRVLLRPGIRLYTAGASVGDVLLDVCLRRRFILGEGLSAASILRGGHSLGPPGIQMKKNLIKQWWEMVELSREHVLPIDTSLHPPGPTGLPRQDLLQGALRHYVSCLELVNWKLPFGIAEVGKCFHTIADGDCRSGERTLGSLCWFCSSKTLSQWRDYWLRHRLLWWRRFAQVPSGFGSSERQDMDGVRAIDISYDFPWGREVVETLRTMDDSALTQMHAGSTTRLRGRDGRRSVLPHLLWLSSDLDRGWLAYISDALSENPSPPRTVLKFHPSLAPIKVALDLGKGPAVDLRLVCQGLASELRASRISVWPGYLDTPQTPLERLFIKYDEMGVLFTVLVSDVTLESGLLHLRHRDTTIRETLHISKLRGLLAQHMAAANTL
ncbi:DNA polymerase subunit gamma-2 isoform X2 [Engystomops pustulosus]|uniref:DNA polymerase subunit gamma-2 isoform X2 n=1 Tax=Engystomops pustulosus TaxID=76066 RepID=UPI003AFA2390